MKEFFELTIVDYGKINITVLNLVEIGVTIAITYLILFLLKKFLRFQSKKLNLQYGDVYAIFQIIKYVVIVIITIMILNTLGIDTTILLTSSAALLVGVGLGLQNIFKDFLSGILLLFSKTIRINDVVEVGGNLGKIIEINLRTTKIVTRDDFHLLVPNSKFVEESVVNWSLEYTHIRLKLSVGIAYGSDVYLAKKILLDSVINNEDVLNEPKPFVRFTDFGNSSLDFELIFWTNNIFGMENVKSEIRFKIDEAFRSNNITIPFPQRTVWINNENTDEENH